MKATKKSREDATRLVDYLLILPEDFAWYTGAVLRGFTVTVRAEDVLLIVKAQKKDTPVVSFFASDTIQNAFRYFYTNLVGGTISWKTDRYAK